MTAKYFAILTNYGAAQLANAVALGTQMNISAMGAGDGGGTLPVPDPAQTTLISENRRAAVNQVSVDDKNPNIIIAEQVIPENEGGWWIREIGLYDDNGGLIAVGNVPETYKPNLQEGSGRTQVLQMALIVSSTQAITLKVDPSVVLATREYVTKSIDAAIQASEARAAQTYQPKGDYVTNPYLKLELLKKIDKADITQQLGNDTGKVVSQNLLATELGKKASVADLGKKVDYGNHTITGGVDSAGNGSVNAANGGIRFYRKKDGTLTLFSREAADSESGYVTEVELPKKKGMAALTSDLTNKIDYDIHVITGGVDSAGRGSVNAANGSLRVHRDASGVITIYGREQADGTSEYVTAAAFPKAKGEVCLDIFTFAAGGAKYRDVKSQRKNGVTYTNTQPRPILVIASYDSPATRTLAYVDGVRVAQTSHGSPSQTGAWGGFVSFIVPAGSKYLVNSNGDKIELLDWVEL
ncbi:TPA: phage tail protein [Morganella morganii]